MDNINNNNRNIIPTGHSSIAHKLKNSFSNLAYGINGGSTSPQDKGKLIRISEFKLEQAGHNQNSIYSLNNSKDLINRLKNQASSLKSTITNKNIINNNKNNKVIDYFHLEDKENLSINKYLQNELSHCHLVKGMNILSRHETFEIDKKKYIYGDKNKFNKNSCFFNDKNNNSNNIINKKNKDYEMFSKIKNLKTFHPGKFSNNKKTISIKVNKDNLDSINKNTNINTQNDLDTNNNNIKNNENTLNEKIKKISKSNNINKSKNKIKYKEKNNKILNKEIKSDIKEKENKNNNKNIVEENREDKKEKEKNKEDIQIIDDKIIKKEKNHKIIEKEKNKLKEQTYNEKNYVNFTEKENPKIINNNSSRIKNNIKDEKDNIDNKNILNNKQIKKIENEEDIKDPEEKVIYFDISQINNIQIPKDYLNIIYYNLLKEENIELNPKPIYIYMKNQKEINEQMRSILVDWIIDVHHKFGFVDETLFMTILIIDRYCSIEQISRIKYQCLGITALMIACKHEEINVPKVEDFIYITDNAYTKDEVFKMENDILSKLNFSLLYPSPIKFYEYLSLHFNFSKKHHMLGKYLMETFLLDLKYIKYKPSIISCACIYIVMKFFKMQNYKQSYDKKFYLVDENVNTISNGFGVKDCAQDICVYVDNINNTNLLSCQKKYTKPEFENVSNLISTNKS